MNIYKKQLNSCIKGLKRIEDYLNRVNFALEDYNTSKDLDEKDKKYKAINVAYDDYLTCNSQVMSSFRELHATHNKEQKGN